MALPDRHAGLNTMQCPTQSLFFVISIVCPAHTHQSPYTTRAKPIVQALYSKEREWDEPLKEGFFKHGLSGKVNSFIFKTLPFAAAVPFLVPSESVYQMHVFCNASEHLHGAVAYLRVTD